MVERGTKARSGWWGGGVPSQVYMVGRGYPSQVWMVGGTRGIPQGQVWMVGGTWGNPQGQVWMVRVTWVPLHHHWMAYPPPSLDGVPPTITGWGTPHHHWIGYPPSLDRVPPPWLDRVPPLDGVPPTMTGWGTPHMTGWVPSMTGWGTPPTIASTCYAAGGMPLRFRQEDFLVYLLNLYVKSNKTWKLKQNIDRSALCNFGKTRLTLSRNLGE